MKQIPLSRSLRNFFIYLFSLLGIMLSVFIFLRVEYVLDTSRESDLKREMAGIEKSLHQYLTSHSSMLKTYSRFPLLTQAVMQPQNNRASVDDMLSEITFFDTHHPLTLLDFSGKVITSTDNTQVTELLTKNSVELMMSGEVSELTTVNKRNFSYFWLIAVPIFYNSLPEGVLLVEIPINAKELKWINSERLSGMKLEIISEGETVFSTKEVGSGELIKHVVNNPKVELLFNFDHSKENSAKNRLIVEMILLLILTIVLAVSISHKLSQKFIISPIKELQKQINAIQSGENREEAINSVPILEISQFISQFHEMANRVKKREISLMASHRNLEETNNQLKLNQAQLLHSDKMASVGQLAAGVAHEINNPVGFVLSNTTTLGEYISDIKEILSLYQKGEDRFKIKELEEKYDIAETLDDIDCLIEDNREGLKRVAKIVQNLKQFSRVDEEESATNEDLTKVINETLLFAKNEIKYVANVSTQFSVSENVSMIRGEINQVLLNIIINATQALKEAGRTVSTGKLIIKTFNVNGSVAISIYDNGNGVKKESFKEIFNPFFTTKSVGEGTGLGLSISYDIVVRKHGGSIDVYSKEGKGTCFIIRLPKKIF